MEHRMQNNLGRPCIFEITCNCEIWKEATPIHSDTDTQMHPRKRHLINLTPIKTLYIHAHIPSLSLFLGGS